MMPRTCAFSKRPGATQLLFGSGKVFHVPVSELLAEVHAGGPAFPQPGPALFIYIYINHVNHDS